MKAEINRELAKELIQKIARKAAYSRKKDKSFYIGSIKIIPKILYIESGEVFRYVVKTYTFKKEYLKKNMKRIVFIAVKNNIPVEVTITCEEDKGYIYLLPRLNVEKANLTVDEIIRSLKEG